MESFDARNGLIVMSCIGLGILIWNEDSEQPGLAKQGGSKSPPLEEVASFAATGKVRLNTLTLSGGRSADEVFRRLLAVAQGPVYGDDRAFKSVAAVPLNQRGRIQLVFGTSDPALIQSAERGARCVEAFVAPQWLPSRPVQVIPLEGEKNRANANLQESIIRLKPGSINVETAVHEIAHLIEYTHPEILSCSKLFIARRGRGGSILRLSELTGNQGYSDNEIAVAGNWQSRGGIAYTGKFYGPSLRDATATEVISTGLERLLMQPRRMLLQDADFFLLLLLTLQLDPAIRNHHLAGEALRR